MLNKKNKGKGNAVLNNDNFSREELIKDFDDSIFENFIEEIHPDDFTKRYGEIIYGDTINIKKRKNEKEDNSSKKKK